MTLVSANSARACDRWLLLPQKPGSLHPQLQTLFMEIKVALSALLCERSPAPPLEQLWAAARRTSLWTLNGSRKNRDREGAVLTETKVTNVPGSPERFELVTRLHPRLLPLLKTPLPWPLGALPCAWRDTEKLFSLPGPPAPPKKEKETQGFQSHPSDTMNTRSALITIPCFSEIVSDTIFSPNYFPLLGGLGSRLEPEEAAQAGQIGTWWAGDYLEEYRGGHLRRWAEGKEVHFRVNVHFKLWSCGHYLLIQRDTVSRSGNRIYNFYECILIPGVAVSKQN